MRGVLNGTLLAISAAQADGRPGSCPRTGSRATAFCSVTVFTYGGLVKAFCSKIPTSGWS